MVRLFTALELPEIAKDRLMATMGGLKNVRWQTRDQLHITLRFIGDVENGTADEITAALKAIRFDPIKVKITGVDFFGKSKKPRQAWAGIENGEPLKKLNKKISQAIEAAGIPKEERKYTPHITLARFKGKPGSKLETFLDHNGGLLIPPFEATGFVLFQSHLGQEGAHYEVIEHYPPSIG